LNSSPASQRKVSLRLSIFYDDYPRVRRATD
jgi:hypothetical protein